MIWSYYLSAGLFLLSLYWALMCGQLRSRVRHLGKELTHKSELIRKLDSEVSTKAQLIAKEIDEAEQAHQGKLKALEANLATAERKNKEYFALIERVLAQRDERWNMFLEHSSQHLNAQNMLERTIVQQREWLGRAVLMINEYRRAEGKPLVEKATDIDAVPVGTAKRFGESMKEMEQAVSAPIDAVAERDKIAEAQ